ncbi:MULTISPECIES: helix-turn-helix transcriptional regulator [unclassified Frankia]|uniref:response regulator transcription factor n=1 Tax=unclassified Frankia TaxID=2632575 RepID=UPI002AD4C2F8|nr:MULTISPECIES: helix-turn-helix transcriptional regulator [unclassified Frankia]
MTEELARLSPRERDVLAHFARGFTYSQIGRRLGIADSTVDTYIRRVRAKTGVVNSAELVRLGLKLDSTID